MPLEELEGTTFHSFRFFRWLQWLKTSLFFRVFTK